MTIYRWLIVSLWLGLIAYWAISAVRAKPSLGARRTWKEIGLRLIVAALVLIVLAVPRVRLTFRALQAYQAQSAVLGVAGVVLCVAGVGLAVLGRFYLGHNWGLPASRKENPELVTDGPYHYVRHPIYGGIMLAMLGTAIGAGAFWVVPLVLFSVYFCLQRRLRRENHDRAIPGVISGLYAANTDVSSVRIVSAIAKLSAIFGRLGEGSDRQLP